MSKSKKRKQVFRSMAEFEKEFFPRAFEKRRAQKPSDAQAFGICLAKESLDEIKAGLSK